MNKIVNRAYYGLMVFLILVSLSILLTGCQTDSDTDVDLPDFVYVPEFMTFPLPEGTDWINNLTVADDLVYFTAYTYEDEDNPFSITSIFSMEFDGSNVKALPNFSVEADLPTNAESGNIYINYFTVDKNGNIWIVETGEFFNLPEDFDGEDWDKWYQREIVKEFTRVRKLDSTGAEINSIDIAHLFAGQDWFQLQGFAVDNEDNIYIGTDSTIYVLDDEGRTAFTLDVQWVERLISMQDGKVAHAGWSGKGRDFSVINFANKSFGQSIELPNNVNEIYPGNDIYTLIFTDGIGLYGIEEESGETVMLLKWIDSDMVLNGLGHIKFLEDGRLIATSQTWDSEGPVHEVIFLTKTPYSELPERSVLTLATFHLDWDIRSAVVKFNRLSNTHRIHVTDYAEFSTDEDWHAGLTRLSTEITAGNVPDILDVSNLPYNQYAARGLLLDLYPLIDADPNINRSDFFESVLRATEINGCLYKIFPNFSIATMLGNPAIVGDYPGWNMEEFNAVIHANPNADYPLGQGLTNLTFLQALFMFNINQFVDWSEGKVNFDSDEFIALLEYAGTLPSEYNWDNDYIPEYELIATGRQIIAAANMTDFDTYQMYRAFFGGDIVFKGLPADNRNGYSLMSQTDFAITSKCKDVDGAWGFLRSFISEEWQKENSWRGIPVSKKVFDDMIKKHMDEDEVGGRAMHWGDDFTVELKALTEPEADQLMTLINSVSNSVGQDDALWNIISEGAADYFNNRSSAQDAVRIIQNRASIYVAEQG